MNKQQAEAKLREAAEKQYPFKEGLQNAHSKLMRERFIYLIKSEAAKEYWQAHQEPKEVDAEELRNRFYKECYHPDYFTKGKFKDTFGPKQIFDWFYPHLQLAMESDAVKFAEWLRINEWLHDTAHSGRNFWYKATSGNEFNIQELYTEFKQSKTKSDE